MVIKTREKEVLFDLSVEPAWSTKVERWYQMDESSFALGQAIFEWDYLEEFDRPALTLLSTPNGSNVADWHFVQSGSSQPARFVYTLPSVPAAVLFQMLDFRGPLYCFQDSSINFNDEVARLVERYGVVWHFEILPRPQVGASAVHYTFLKAK